jgi:hypothetical protein
VIIFLYWSIINKYNITEQFESTSLLQDLDITPMKDTLGEQRYLSYLSDVNDAFQQAIPKTGPFKGTCNDTINKIAENKALKSAYDKMMSDKTKFNGELFEKDHCVTLANWVCEFTDPNMYLSESLYFPPRWIVPTLAKMKLPKTTSLSCFNTNLNCCRRAQKNKTY